jgi:hypothetical protein
MKSRRGKTNKNVKDKGRQREINKKLELNG